MYVKKKTKQVCIGCIYFDECGITTRTEPCGGRTTKSQFNQIRRNDISKLADKIANIISESGCRSIVEFKKVKGLNSVSFRRWVITLYGAEYGVTEDFIQALRKEIHVRLSKLNA